MLSFAADEFDDNEINEYIIPATDDNKKFLIDLTLEMVYEIDIDDEVSNIVNEKDEISTSDCLVMRYLSKRCKELSKK